MGLFPVDPGGGIGLFSGTGGGLTYAGGGKV